MNPSDRRAEFGGTTKNSDFAPQRESLCGLSHFPNIRRNARGKFLATGLTGCFCLLVWQSASGSYSSTGAHADVRAAMPHPLLAGSPRQCHSPQDSMPPDRNAAFKEKNPAAKTAFSPSALSCSLPRFEWRGPFFFRTYLCGPWHASPVKMIPPPTRSAACFLRFFQFP